jgi:hypothetical protein
MTAPKNYYGWHVAERCHRHMAEGWRTVAIKYMSLNDNESTADKTHKKLARLIDSKL